MNEEPPSGSSANVIPRNVTPSAVSDADSKRDLCLDFVQSHPELCQVGYYDRSVCVFSMDTFDDPTTRLPAATTECRDVYDRVGRQIGFVLFQLEDLLDGAQVGSLLRTTLQTDRGLVIHCPVTPGEYVVTHAVETEMFHDADQCAEDLATRLREQVAGSGSGRIAFRAPTGRKYTVSDRFRRRSRPRMTLLEGRSHDVEEVFQRSLDPAVLLFLSYRGDEASVCADVLGGLDVQATEPLGCYIALHRRFDMLAAQCSRMTRSVVYGSLSRIILDAERGGVLYHRLNESDYLMGVTRDRDAMPAATEALVSIAESLSRR